MEDLLFNLLQPMQLLAVLGGFFVAIFINLTGIGGGVLVVPMLTILFNLSPVYVVGTEALYITFTKFFSSAMHVYNKTVNWKVCTYFLMGALPSSIFASYKVVTISQKGAPWLHKVEMFVHYSIIVIMLAACISMLLNKTTHNTVGKQKPFRLVVSGFFAGIVIAVTGIGGGVLVIPLLSYAAKISIKSMISCSIVIAFIISTSTGLIYSSKGYYNLPLLISLLIGSAFGLYISKFLQGLFSAKQLKYLVIGAILLAAIAMLLRP